MGSLNVAITVENADAVAKLAVTEARAKAAESAFKGLAKASLESEAAAAQLAPALQQSAVNLGDMQAAAARAKTELAQLSGGVTASGHAASGAHSGWSGLVRELRAFGDEVSSGRTKQSPGTLLLIATKLYAISPAAFGAVAGVAALTAGIAALAANAMQARTALDQMHTAAVAAGSNVTREQFQQVTEELAKLPGVATWAARSIAIELEGVVPNVEALTAASRLAAEEMGRTGESAQEAGKRMAERLRENVTVSHIAEEEGRALSDGQREQAKKTDELQDATAVLVTKLQLLESVTARNRVNTDEYTRSLGESFSGTVAWLGLTSNADLNATAEILGVTNQKWRDNGAAIREATASLAASEHQKPLVFDQTTALERMRERMEKLAETWDGTQSGMLAKQREIAQASLAEVSKGSGEWEKIQREMARLSVEAHRAAGQEAIAAAHQQIAEIGSATQQGAIQRLQAEEVVWAETLAHEKLTAAQRVEAQKSLTTAAVQLAKEYQTEAIAIARSDAETEIALNRQALEAKKTTLDLELQAHKITAEQKLATEKELTSQLNALDLQQLDAELALLKPQTAEYERVANQRKILAAKLNSDLLLLDKQYEAESGREAKEQVKIWQSVVNEIEGAESRMVSDIFTKRQGLSRDLQQIGRQLVEQEIANDVKAMTTKLLLANTEEASKKALEQGGALYHLLVESQKTTATAAGTSARTAAVTAGNAAQAASTISAAAASKAASGAAGRSTVMQDAAKAFSGTYASVAQIPYVGWILAPIAATAAFAAVAAYEGMASLDTGAYDVPQDMTARIHQGEMVLPRPFAEEARRTGFLGGGEGGGGGSVTHNYGGTIHVSDTSMRRLLSSAGNQRAVMETIAGAFRRGARPVLR